MIKRICLLLIILLYSKTFAADSLPYCKEGFTSHQIERSLCKKTWSIFIFMAADNDLENYAQENLQQILQGKSYDKNLIYDVVVELDARGNSGSTRMLLEEDIYILEKLVEKNTGDPRTLENFLIWAQTQFPAEHYAIIIWGHGDGWAANNSVNAKREGLGTAFDETSQAWLNTPALKNVLRGKIFDLYISDACFMQTAEFIFELRENARYIFGSTPMMENLGLPYDILLQNLAQKKYSPREMAKELPRFFQQRYPDAIASSVETNSLPLLAQALNDLADIATPWIRSDVLLRLRLLEIISQTKRYQTSVRDLNHFLHLWSLLTTNTPELSRQIQQSQNALKQSILGVSTNAGFSEGLSIWLPLNPKDFVLLSPQFQSSALHHFQTKDGEFTVEKNLNAWGSFLRELYNFY